MFISVTSLCAGKPGEDGDPTRGGQDPIWGAWGSYMWPGGGQQDAGAGLLVRGHAGTWEQAGNPHLTGKQAAGQVHHAHLENR